jgi:hypothetical protein
VTAPRVDPPWRIADTAARTRAVLALARDDAAEAGAVAALEALVPWLTAHPRPDPSLLPEPMLEGWAWHASDLAALMPAIGDADEAVVQLYLAGRNWDESLAPAVKALFDWGARHQAAVAAADWLALGGRGSAAVRALLDRHGPRLDTALRDALARAGAGSAPG